MQDWENNNQNDSTIIENNEVDTQSDTEETSSTIDHESDNITEGESEGTEAVESLIQLTPEEARALGCLVEKQKTTPAQYPLTLNSLQLACNQKTSRNPIMEVYVGELKRTVDSLIEKGFVRKNHFSTRAEKYEQHIDSVLGLSEARIAILAVLMLRGDQTLAEIKAHTSRIHEFADYDEVQSNLDTLLEHSTPMAIALPKKPGAKETRYTHLFCGEPDIESYLAEPISKAVKNKPMEELLERIEVLEKRLQALEEQAGIEAN